MTVTLIFVLNDEKLQGRQAKSNYFAIGRIAAYVARPAEDGTFHNDNFSSSLDNSKIDEVQVRNGRYLTPLLIQRIKLYLYQYSVHLRPQMTGMA